MVAGIELGGILRSPDGGETWQDQRPGAYADCHSLAAHPSSPEALYEAGGGGFAESGNFGDSWRAADDGMGLHYVWGLAVDSEDPLSSTPLLPPALIRRTGAASRTRRSTAAGTVDGGSLSWRA